MPKAKKRAAGEFPPTQFATCIENGLNIHVQTIPSKEDKKKSKNKEASKSKKGKKHIVENPAARAKGAASSTKSNQSYPKIECTNGAMEALQLCHSEFIKATSSALVALESSTKNNNNKSESSTKKKVSFSSTTKTITYNEHHVVECMKQMGFSNLVERAMKSLNSGSSTKQQGTPTNKMRKLKASGTSKPPQSSSSSSQSKKRRKRSNPLDDAALLAEQERLLSESARRVYHIHNQQQQQQQNEAVGKSPVVATAAATANVAVAATASGNGSAGGNGMV